MAAQDLNQTAGGNPTWHVIQRTGSIATGDPGKDIDVCCGESIEAHVVLAVCETRADALGVREVKVGKARASRAADTARTLTMLRELHHRVSLQHCEAEVHSAGHSYLAGMRNGLQPALNALACGTPVRELASEDAAAFAAVQWCDGDRPAV